MPCEMRTDQNTNPRRLRPTDGLLKPIDHFRFFWYPIRHPPHLILATPLRTALPGLRKRDTRFVADVVVADVVCGRLWPISSFPKDSTLADEQRHHNGVGPGLHFVPVPRTL